MKRERIKVTVEVVKDYFSSSKFVAMPINPSFKFAGLVSRPMSSEEGALYDFRFKCFRETGEFVDVYV